MIRQAWAILVLKWLLLRHAMTPGKALSWGVTAVFFLLLLIIALPLSAGLFYLGLRGFNYEDPLLVLGLYDLITLVFFFFWFWGLLIELQRADVIDFRKMLFLPVSLPMVFSLNYLASLIGPACLIFALGCIGLHLGLAFQFGPAMLLGLPIAAAFFMMLGAWAYYLRGMLAILMENKRRRRLIMTLLPMCFILLGQTPSLLTHLLRNGSGAAAAEGLSERLFESLLLYGNLLLPPAWMPIGLWSVHSGNYLAALSACVGLLTLTALGLRLGYRATWRYYTGAESRPKQPRKNGASKRSRRVFTARRLPLLSEDTAAMTLNAWLTYLRHPNIRSLLLMPLCMGAFIMMMYRSGAYGDQPSGGMWMPVIILIWPFFNFSFVLLNLFGVDRAAFQGLILLPTPRRRYLLAKNLALFPFVGGLSFLFILLGAVLMAVELKQVLLSLVQVIQLYLAFCIAGNYTSLFLIYHINRDGMRARANRPMMLLIGLAAAAFTGLMLIPSSFCINVDRYAADYGYAGPIPLGLLFSVALLACTALLYAFTLVHAGDLFALREQHMHTQLARDRE